MKRTVILFLLFTGLISSVHHAQDQQSFIETSIVINVEVPVRVFKNWNFIDDLKLEDFEVYENDFLQKVEAVYLVDRDTIARREEKRKYRPETGRTFYLFFEISEYDPRLGQALDNFVGNVFLEGDKLIAVTPVKTYRLKDEGLKRKSREGIARELKSLVRKDCISGSSEYRNAIKELTDFTRSLSSIIASAAGMEDEGTMRPAGQEASLVTGLEEIGLDAALDFYMGYIQKLNVLRQVEELKLMDFAKHLKMREGQKYVFFFYQREFIPQGDPKIWIQASTELQNVEGVDLSHMMADIMNFYNQDIPVDVVKVKQAYADASTSIHFLFITKPPPIIPGVYFAERSADVYTPFSEVARASGGFMDSSSNPEILFDKALEAAARYYLLYYTPKDYTGDGKFRSIRIRVKTPGCKVIHRLGYYSN